MTDQLDIPTRVVLEGVPYIGPDLYRLDTAGGARRCLEGATFPSTLRACLEYVGDTMGSKVISVNGDPGDWTTSMPVWWAPPGAPFA